MAIPPNFMHATMVRGPPLQMTIVEDNEHEWDFEGKKI